MPVAYREVIGKYQGNLNQLSKFSFCYFFFWKGMGIVCPPPPHLSRGHFPAFGSGKSEVDPVVRV